MFICLGNMTFQSILKYFKRLPIDWGRKLHRVFSLADIFRFDHRFYLSIPSIGLGCPNIFVALLCSGKTFSGLV